MRQPTSQKNGARRTIAYSATKTAPVRGWNAVDPITAVREDEAIVLDNWFPRRSNLETRKGSKVHSTGFAKDVQTVITYTGLTESKLFAANADGIWDVTDGGPIADNPGSFILNGEVQYTNFSTQAVNYLICVNGTDTMRIYDGVYWQSIFELSSPIFITGATTSDFVHVCAFKERLIFTLKDEMAFAYLDPGAVGGVASRFPLQGIFNKGGSLMSVGTWTVDAGDGVDDHCVFITTEGEVAIYRGTDPGDADNWALVGVYVLARPLSRKCMLKYGGDLLLILRDGIIPISTALQSSTVDRAKAVTGRVDNAWQDSAGRYGNKFGWSACLFKEGPFLLCNIPNETFDTSVQYVMNTTTRAWTRFTGIGGVDFTERANRLFVARGKEVCEMWVGTADYDQPINFRAKTGFSNFNYPGNIKHWTTVRPVLEFVGPQGLLIGLDVDFEDGALSGTVGVSADPYGVWDASLWDFATFGPDFYLSQVWTTIASKPGYYAATKLEHSSANYNGQWFVTNYIFETGGLV